MGWGRRDPVQRPQEGRERGGGREVPPLRSWTPWGSGGVAGEASSSKGGKRVHGGAGNLGDSRGGWLTGEALQDTHPLGECQGGEGHGAAGKVGDPAWVMRDGPQRHCQLA